MKKKVKGETLREMLVGAIIEYANDELDRNDWMELATLDEKQLAKQVISILEYYADQYNS